MLLQNFNRGIDTKTKAQLFIQIESIWKVYQAHKRSRLSVNSSQLILALWTALIVFESMVLRAFQRNVCNLISKSTHSFLPSSITISPQA